MKILELKSKQEMDVNDSYGARLIEQGKAVIPPERGEAKPKTKEKAEKDAEK